MSKFTLDDLRILMRKTMGQSDLVDLDGDIADMSFPDLGYDSLALLELSARLSDVYGVHIEDGEMGRLETPRAVVEYVAAQGAVR